MIPYCGLAVVAYDCAAARQHLAHEVSGLLAPCGDFDAFVGLAAAAVQDPLRTRQLRVQARAAAERIDWESVFDDVEAVLLDVIHRRELEAA